MITDSYDITTKPLLSMKDFYGEAKHIVDTCLIIFSKEIHSHLLETFDCEVIGKITACNGSTPIYKMHYKGADVAFYLTGIGSALASGTCCEANWLTGATKFIIPTESYRGEGASYYYAPPADYITVKNSARLAAIFEEMGVPYVTGRIWTTDSMLRETLGLVEKRKAEGCIAVEMEVAGVQAVCDFYHMELYDFLEAGDVLEASGYEVEGLQAANHNLGKLYIALETALRL